METFSHPFPNPARFLSKVGIFFFFINVSIIYKDEKTWQTYVPELRGGAVDSTACKFTYTTGSGTLTQLEKSRTVWIWEPD